MHISNVNNNYRVNWVTQSIELLRSKTVRANPTLFDIGAGMQPYRKIAQDAGFVYKSHDFTQYDPKNNENKSVGIHTIGWTYPKQDVVCDILEIPTDEKFDLVICTEVLEHVPDPVSSLKKLFALAAEGGHVLITVPFGSMTHQA
ncbi:MAG: methyltransferase domain-containing protein, partial [Actinobacteria bacterium]|nr:methyltransferase domain-containing protein [Actinomycetota bacterium]